MYVLIAYETHKFVAELKRELADGTKEAARSYLGQAGLYQGTDVKLGPLLILDLTDMTDGVPALEENVWLERVSMKDGALWNLWYSAFRETG